MGRKTGKGVSRELPRQSGNRGEDAAAAYLQGRGCEILDRQWRCRCGELDLVAREGDVICFVEVKLRKAGSRILPREAVDRRKQEKLRKTAALWLAAKAPEAPARFDVAEVFALPDGELRIDYLPDAFQ